MKQLVVIDTQTEIGKNVAALLHTLSTDNKSISFLTEDELEEAEDKVLGAMMTKSLESGIVDQQELLKLLGRV